MKKFRIMVSAYLDYDIEAKSEEDAKAIAEETWFKEMQFLGNKYISLYEIEEER